MPIAERPHIRSYIYCGDVMVGTNVARMMGTRLLLAAMVAAGSAAAAAQELQDEAAIARGLSYITGAAPDAPAPAIDLDILFKLDSAELDPRAARQLEALARALRLPALSAAQIGIFGHTDASGGAEHNQRLSLARGEAVRGWLIEREAIAAERLVARGFGFRRLKDGANPRNPANRRVEIVNLSPRGPSSVAPSAAPPPTAPVSGTQSITQ
ncbi:MAG: OmpA family protein [Alphaproteobacteria bacterium]|nr:OmpA family protein [Alphaproteobacteria bacterium]